MFSLLSFTKRKCTLAFSVLTTNDVRFSNELLWCHIGQIHGGLVEATLLKRLKFSHGPLSSFFSRNTRLGSHASDIDQTPELASTCTFGNWNSKRAKLGSKLRLLKLLLLTKFSSAFSCFSLRLRGGDLERRVSLRLERPHGLSVPKHTAFSSSNLLADLLSVEVGHPLLKRVTFELTHS